MGIIEIAGIIAALIGTAAGIAQVLDYLEKRREKRQLSLTPKEVQQVTTPSPQEHPRQKRQDWGEAVDVTVFYGRETELATLERWIATDHCRLVAILGMGGIGKTALSVKLAEQIKDILASSGYDETIKLWDVRSDECLKTLYPHQPHERMNITGVKGLTEAQKATLRALGAIEE